MNPNGRLEMFSLCAWFFVKKCHSHQTLNTFFACRSVAQKKSVSQENLPRAGYTNNFGHSVGGEGYRGVEGVLIANLAKPLVSRCVECASDLYGTENIVSEVFIVVLCGLELDWVVNVATSRHFYQLCAEF